MGGELGAQPSRGGAAGDGAAWSCPWPRAAPESRDKAGCHRRGAGNKDLFFRV